MVREARSFATTRERYARSFASCVPVNTESVFNSACNERSLLLDPQRDLLASGIANYISCDRCLKARDLRTTTSRRSPYSDLEPVDREGNGADERRKRQLSTDTVGREKFARNGIVVAAPKRLGHNIHVERRTLNTSRYFYARSCSSPMTTPGSRKKDAFGPVILVAHVMKPSSPNRLPAKLHRVAAE